MAEDHAVGQPIFAGKLTKKALETLSGSAYLVSNCLLAVDVPIIADHVPADPERLEQFWQKIRGRKLAGSLFYGFKSRREYEIWLQFRHGRPTVEALSATQVQREASPPALTLVSKKT